MMKTGQHCNRYGQPTCTVTVVNAFMFAILCFRNLTFANIETYLGFDLVNVRLHKQTKFLF